GLGLRVDRDGELRRVRHGGSWAGFKAEILRYPDRRVSVVVLCNRRDAVPGRLARALASQEIPELRLVEAAAAGSGEAAPADPAPPSAAEAQAPDTRELRRLEGLFYSEEIDATWRIVAREDRLSLERRGSEPVALAPVSRDVFEAKGIGRIAFRRGPSGDPERFEIPLGQSRLPFLALRREGASGLRP
ncbi:MAG TPA: hypothetical protein VIZ69_05565, partial [Thermoanaerobaculia bacterium]